MEKLISIVVPIYNVEKYLRKCIDSIINQTYKNIEIILIDDGSPDNCGIICDEYAKKDNRIVVVHKENGGLSEARNTGIKISKGAYICFVDSDDFIGNKYIEILYRMCKETNCKIAQCEFYQFEDENDINLENKKIICKKTEKREMLKGMYNEKYLNNVVAWNKLYEKQLFNNILYTTGKINEDESTTYKLFLKCDSVICTNQKLYFYRMRQGGITKSKFSSKNLDYIDAMEERLKIFKQINDIELYDLTLERYFYILIIFYYKSKEYIPTEKVLIEKIYKRIKSVGKELFKSKYTNRPKFCIYIFYIFPKLFITLKNIKNIVTERKFVWN